MTKSENLFLSTWRLTPAKEDHLTEFVCACLRNDVVVLNEYVSILTEARSDLSRLRTARVVSITTQEVYPETSCRPDVLIVFENGFRLLCEHKIDSDETAGEESGNAVGQIERYLKLPVDAVAYIRSSWKPPKASVVSHPKYLKPIAGSHFLWADFYPAFQTGKTVIAQWMTEAFEKFGYTPASPEIGDLFDTNETVAKSNRQNLAKHFKAVRDWSVDLGWHVGAGSICQLYLDSGNYCVRQILINPYSNAGRNLQIRLTPQNHSEIRLIQQVVESVVPQSEASPIVSRNTVKRAKGFEDVIDVQIGFSRLIETASAKKNLAQKLFDCVIPIIKAVSRKSIP